MLDDLKNSFDHGRIGGQICNPRLSCKRETKTCHFTEYTRKESDMDTPMPTLEIPFESTTPIPRGHSDRWGALARPEHRFCPTIWLFLSAVLRRIFFFFFFGNANIILTFDPSAYSNKPKSHLYLCPTLIIEVLKP